MTAGGMVDAQAASEQCVIKSLVVDNMESVATNPYSSIRLQHHQCQMYALTCVRLSAFTGCAAKEPNEHRRPDYMQLNFSRSTDVLRLAVSVLTFASPG